MPAIFDLLYRENWRARLAEMRTQPLFHTGSDEVPEADCAEWCPDGDRDGALNDQREVVRGKPGAVRGYVRPARNA
jgi:hypothetical protein